MFSKMIYSLAILSFLGFLVMPAMTQAVDDCRTVKCTDKQAICEVQSDGTYACVNVKTGKYGLGSTFKGLGIGQSSDLKGTIADIINIILGFLGIVAVIIILAGGFKWMTAGGNEDSVGEAKKMIYGGIIGLVVIFAAWAIASFVIAGLQGATAA